MSRWRDVKQGKIKKSKIKLQQQNIPHQIICASLIIRIKAFITDMFMLMMPIMYITTYIILSGKDEFQSNQIARWLTMFVYGLIVILFWSKTGQTPGYKAYSLKLVTLNNNKDITFLRATLRYMLFIISAVSLVGIILPFFRKDKKTFQDLATNTCVIIEKKV
jgi:uncharacterized RDD family membrane protein YckC